MLPITSKWPKRPQKIALTQTKSWCSHGFVYGVIPTPVGNLIVVCEGDYFLQVTFLPTLQNESMPLDLKHDEGHVHKLMQKEEWMVKISPAATPLKMQVLEGLLTIPYGETLSYKQFASGLGYEKSARAIANIIGTNPLPYFIPCHRVIRSNKEIGGFAWGSEIKKAFLDAECIRGEG